MDVLAVLVSFMSAIEVDMRVFILGIFRSFGIMPSCSYVLLKGLIYEHLFVHQQAECSALSRELHNAAANIPNKTHPECVSMLLNYSLEKKKPKPN
jgi:hypothetical protein